MRFDCWYSAGQETAKRRDSEIAEMHDDGKSGEKRQAKVYERGRRVRDSSRDLKDCLDRVWCVVAGAVTSRDVVKGPKE